MAFEGKHTVGRQGSTIEPAPANSLVGAWEWDAVNKVMSWTDELYRLHGLEPGVIPLGSQSHIDRSLECYLPADRSQILSAFQNLCVTGEPYDLQVRFTPFTGKPIWVRIIGAAVRENGIITKVIGIVIDITTQRLTEEALQTALKDQTALLQEVHHRVKNNLQVVSSLLSLQSTRLQSPELRHILADTQNRVRSMALLHETLYRSGKLSHIDLPSYVESLCANLLQAVGPGNAQIRLERRIESMDLPLDQAVPCGLIINELVSNAFKHAFPDGRPGSILVEAIFGAPSEVILTVSNDGVRLPDHVNPGESPTLGLQLVAMLAEQIQGSLEIERNAETRFRITFPIRER